MISDMKFRKVYEVSSLSKVHYKAFIFMGEDTYALPEEGPAALSEGMKTVTSLRAPSTLFWKPGIDKILVAIGMFSAAVVSVTFVGSESIDSTT